MLLQRQVEIPDSVPSTPQAPVAGCPTSGADVSDCAVPPPSLDKDLGLRRVVEDFPLQQLSPQLADDLLP